MDKFTGKDLREFREKNKLSRNQLASMLGVSAVTIEKWEQNPDKEIRSVYHNTLTSIGAMGAGAGVAMGVASAVAAPALLTVGLGALGVSMLTGGTGLMLNDSKDVKALAAFLEKYNSLSESEKESYISIMKKFSE